MMRFLKPILNVDGKNIIPTGLDQAEIFTPKGTLPMSQTLSRDQSKAGTHSLVSGNPGDDSFDLRNDCLFTVSPKSKEGITAKKT
jgi:hypothetical protein